MLVKKHKSGQAAIVLVVITMVTVLGIAVASSSQTRINLKDTVYSTQANQALACAEAGVDRALVDDYIQNEDTTVTPVPVLNSTDSGYAVSGCDGYEVEITPYPASGGNVTIVNVPENSVQQFLIEDYSNGDTINIRFKSTDPAKNAGLAVYQYYGTSDVQRTMYFCNSGAAEPSSTPEDFTSLSGNTDIVVDSTTTIVAACSLNITAQSNAKYLRVRPLFADSAVQIPSFEGETGFIIDSVGTAGAVTRRIEVLRFFSQLSSAFDEAIVSFSSSEPLAVVD